MNNLPILYATLGALIGLPCGYGFAWVVSWLSPLVGLALGLRSIDGELAELTALLNEITAADRHAEVKP